MLVQRDDRPARVSKVLLIRQALKGNGRCAASAGLCPFMILSAPLETPDHNGTKLRRKLRGDKKRNHVFDKHVATSKRPRGRR